MDINEFKRAISQLRDKLGNQNFLKFDLDNVYEHPENYLSYLSYIIHIAREMRTKFGPALNRSVEEIARHCEDKLLDQDNPGRLSAFSERILQVPVMWAAYALKDTLVDGLEYPYQQYFNPEHFPSSLCSYPKYAIKVVS